MTTNERIVPARPSRANGGRSAPRSRSSAGAAVGAHGVRVLDPQPDDREVGHREREHRPERVDQAEELGLAREQRDARERGEHQDPHVRRAEPRVQPAQVVRHLPVHAHRVHEPRDPEHAGVRRRDEDRDRQDRHVDLREALERAELHVLDDAEDRVRGVAAVLLGDAEQRRALAGRVAGDRQRRQRDPGEREVDREHGDHHPADRRRDRLGLLLGLPGHVRDRLDAGVGDACRAGSRSGSRSRSARSRGGSCSPPARRG